MTIKEFMDYMDNSTETKCRVFEKETNQLLFSGSMWEIPEHYKNRKCTFGLPMDFSESIMFFVEPFDTTGMMAVICVTHHLETVKYGETCYFDRDSINIDANGGIYGWLFSKNGRRISYEPLCRFKSVGQ